MSTIIKVEGLGKSYTISHEEHERYTALRDVIARKTKKIFSFNKSTNKQIHSSTKEEFWALKDINFEVQQGDRIGIIGRNGAGKSTLLKILSRITEPTKGSVKIKGRVASLLEVGTGFHPELTGAENIYLNGAILGMSRAEVKKKFDEIVDFAEVEKFLDTPVKKYSSGMYVRLAFAVAAHLEPEILVVDEVLAVGDAEFQKKCLGKMEDVSKNEGRTVLFVSHNMAAIEQLCNYGLVLKNGSLTYFGQSNDSISFYIGQYHSGEKIISHILKNDPIVKILKIKANGMETDEVDLKSNENELDFEITGELIVPCRIELEIRIFDRQGLPLGFYSPGHENGYTEMRGKGKFILNRKLVLPRMMRGIYSMAIALTHPGYKIWVDIPRALTIKTHGAATITGQVFDYSDGNGWILLTNK